MKKILTALAIILTLTLGAVFPLLTQNKISARADAIGESTEEIDSLFVEVGAELKTLDSSFNIIDGEKSNYLAQFDEDGTCTKAGFKLIEVYDYVGGKTIYFYRTQNVLGCFLLSVDTFGISYNNDVYTYSTTSLTSTLLSDNNQYAKMLFDSSEKASQVNWEMDFTDKVTGLTYYSTGAGPDIYTFAFLYFEVDVSEDEESAPGGESTTPPTSETVKDDDVKVEVIESTDVENFGDGVAEWMNANLGVSITSSGAVILLILLAVWLIKKK